MPPSSACSSGLGHILRQAAAFAPPRECTSESKMCTTAANSDGSAQFDGARPPPGLPPPFWLPSHGSLLHGTGKCKPCVWFHKAAGCGNGQECGHCHLCPHREIGDRRRRRRQQVKQVTPVCDEELATDVGSDLESLESFGSAALGRRLTPKGL